MVDMKTRLLKALSSACSLTGTDWDDDAIRIAHVKLMPYGEHALRAINKAIETTEYKLTIASIMKYLPKAGDHPDAELAWSHVPKTEGEAAYVTNAMLGAMAAAQELYDAGDRVAARMAFKSAYEELIKTSKQEFFFSGGYGGDHESRKAIKRNAIEKARQYGWLTEEKAQKLLTNDGLQETSTGSVPLLEASTSQRTQTPQRASGLLSEAAREALAQLKQQTG